MTDTREALVAEAIARIDAELPAMAARSLVPADEVADLLLDLRMTLAPLAVAVEDVVPS